MKNGHISNSPAGQEARPHGICHKPRTTKQKICLLMIILLAILLLVIGLFCWGFTVQIEVCTSIPCVRTATDILKHINTKVDPCDDFYRFSCGTFLQNTNLDNRGSKSVQNFIEDEIQNEIRNILEQPIRPETPKSLNTAKKFYRACMNESAIDAAGLKKIKEILDRIGGWPTLLGNNWRENDFDWIEVVHKLRQMGVNFDIFFLVSVEPDRADESRYVLGIHGSQCSPSEMSDEVKETYSDYMADVAHIFGANYLVAKRDSNEVLRLFLELAKITKETDLNTKNKTDDDYERLTLSELIYKYPEVQWFQYINGLLNPAEMIDYDDEVIVVNPFHMKEIGNFLKNTPKRSMANYIAWHTITYLINFLPSNIVDRTYELVEKVYGKTIKMFDPRWKQCLLETNRRMSSVISATYIQTFFPEDTRRRIVDMIRNIKMQFQINLLRLEWMDKETKGLILEKLHSSGEEIPSYADLLGLLESNRIYDEVIINETQYLESALNLYLVNVNEEFHKLTTEVKDEWLINSFFITGFTIKYSPKRNILTFPLGIFRDIYYGPERPEYANYGGLASIIAHEISHIFMMAEHGDVSPGELRSWWSPESLVNYDEKLQCLADQYGSFVVPELGSKKLNPGKTRDEDMADLAGMKISYDTYINWNERNGPEPLLPGLNYSANQLFWISAATRHCSKHSGDSLERSIEKNQWSPEQFRVNGPLQNLNEFAFDFGCAKGSRMNPEKKCDIW